MEHVDKRRRLTAVKLVKAVIYALITRWQALVLRIYISHLLRDGYQMFSAGNSRFYGPPDFIEACRMALGMGMEKDRELFEPLILKRGIILFPQDPQIGFYANQNYGHFSVSKEYLSYGPEGIVALIAFIGFLQRHQVRIGNWETAIPTLPKSELMALVGEWLKSHEFSKSLVDTYLPQ